MDKPPLQERKVIGIGLNKTGTKTLRSHLLALGFHHQTYDLDLFKHYRAGNWEELFAVMDAYDSFEDWPWPLLYREFDQRYPDAVFVLTTRKTPETWYRSLCKMAVRMGPLRDFERHIYGYSMPHGRQQEHIDYYEKFNAEVKAHFKDRPGKLLEICWDNGDTAQKLTDFLGVAPLNVDKVHLNKSESVYTGDKLWLAHANRIVFQTKWYFRKGKKRVKQQVKRMINYSE